MLGVGIVSPHISPRRQRALYKHLNSFEKKHIPWSFSKLQFVHACCLSRILLAQIRLRLLFTQAIEYSMVFAPKRRADKAGLTQIRDPW